MVPRLYILTKFVGAIFECHQIEHNFSFYNFFFLVKQKLYLGTSYDGGYAPDIRFEIKVMLSCPQVLDIVNDPHPVATDSGRMDMDIKQEKPGSPPDAMQTGDDRMGSPPGIKTEPVPSPLGSGGAGVAAPRLVTNDDLVQEQQRQIEELRNQLLLSQSKLQVSGVLLLA